MRLSVALWRLPETTSEESPLASVAPGHPLMEIENVSYRYAGAEALTAIDLSIVPGEFLSIIGPSGCGKSTLLKLIAGVFAPASGAIRHRGRDLGTLQRGDRRTVMVWQSLALFPHMTVEQNVGFGLAVRRVARSERRRRVSDALAMVHLGEQHGRRIQELSGGEQQRVAIARALVVNPETVLLDEPFGALDAHLRTQLLGRLRKIHRESGITFVMVTHDHAEALYVSSRIAVMRGGRLDQVGTPEEILTRPATAFVAEFVGRKNSIPGVLKLVEDRSAIVHTAVGDLAARLPDWISQPPTSGQTVAYVVPSHRLAIGSHRRNVLNGRLEARILDGSRDTLEVAVPAIGLLRVEQSTPGNASGPDLDKEISVTWSAEDAYVLHSEPGRENDLRPPHSTRE
jgi:ABC-type Fe3+/spermidine/putrescine transport system ATPase subunit